MRARFAPLGLGILLSLLASSAALAAQPAAGDEVLLQADEVDYDVDRKVVYAKGHVEIDYGGRVLLADQVSYDQNTDTMSADGHVSVMQPNGDVAFANHVQLTDKLRDGALTGFAALIGKNGRLVASSANREAGVHTTAYNAAYTPCKICREKGEKTPVWSVRAYRVYYDEAKHKVEFKNATLEFFGVPVFYTPYYSTPDPTVKHASGVLTPEIGSSTSIGYFGKLPIYIAFSDSEDMTLTPFVTTEGGEVLEAEYRRRSNSGGMWLQGSAAQNPNGGLLGNVNEFYWHAFGAGDWDISRSWRTGYDLQLTNNDTYMRRYDISQLDRLVNDVFVEGIKGRSRFYLSAFYFQGLRAGDDAKVIPFALPLMEYSYVPDRHVLHGQVRIDLSSVALYRDMEVPGLPNADQRMTLEARYRLPFVTDGGQLITFTADARGDLYHIGHFVPGVVATNDKFVARGLPYLAVDWRWPFVAGSGNRAFVIEPIVQGIWAPYGSNPASIPNEDSTSFEFSDNNLFSFDRLPGYDLMESGPRLNVGLKADAYFPGGTVEALLGQVFRPKADPIFGPDTGLFGTTSDIVGRVSVKFPPFIDLTHRIDINRSDGSIRRNEVYLTGIFDRSAVQVSYLRLAAVPSQGLTAREEINAQATIGLFDYWEVFAAGRRDLLASQLLDTEFGLGYEDECLGIALAYRRSYTTDRDPAAFHRNSGALPAQDRRSAL
jgi:LPS-assembly protein